MERKLMVFHTNSGVSLTLSRYTLFASDNTSYWFDKTKKQLVDANGTILGYPQCMTDALCLVLDKYGGLLKEDSNAH